MRVAQGGTKIHCPFCEAVQVCEAIPSTECGKSSGQRWYKPSHTDIQWFRRGRRCLECRKKFLTAEVDEGFLDELVELRNALSNIKSNAEEYINESSAAAGALERLTKSLSLLRALKIYQETEVLTDKPLSELELSVRATNCLESMGIDAVGKLCNKTASELLEIRNFSEVVLREVTQKLAEKGLHLRVTNKSLFEV